MFTRKIRNKVYHPWARPVLPDALEELDAAIAMKMSELLEVELERDVANHERDISGRASSFTTESVKRTFLAFSPAFAIAY